jgi:histidinol-phosphate/aromatic aminotransferase/cobyric acid decarboxylase-like protein
LKRRRPDPRHNLSSNELIHFAVEPVLAEALSAARPALLRQYPVTAAAIDEIGGHLGLHQDELMLAPGSDSLLRQIAWYYARTATGSPTLILQWPNYDAWEQVVAASGLELRRIVAPQSDGASQDDLLLAAARLSSRALVALSTPNGPGGRVVPKGVLDELVEISRERDHLLVIDSCYQAFHGPLTTQLERRGANVLVVQTLSKSHGLAGARMAVLAGEPALIAALAQDRLEQTVSATTVELARAVLSHAGAFTRIWSDIATAREHAAVELRALGFSPIESGGNFLTVAVGTQHDAAAVTHGFSARGYRIRELTAAQGLPGHVRFTVGDPQSTTQTITVFRDVVANLHLGQPVIATT